MAMLAEPKRRQRWSLNPRGTIWSNDDNKIGQKLLEKMGWSKGKGLGREEQGDKDHILIQVKNNSKGLGYKGKDDEWIKHYEGFENVLATLNSENNSAAASPCSSTPNSNLNSEDEDSKVISLEARSKSSQARVHYHKFTRGKDLSRYNADDIACITGSKRAKKLAEAAKEKNFEEEEVGNKDHTNGVTTVKGGNIQDYFAKKMALLKGQLNEQQEDTVGVNDNTEYVVAKEEAEYVWEEGDPEWENIEKPKDKKKRKKVKGTEDTEVIEHTENNMEECEERIEKKKKKKKRKLMLEDSQLISEENEYKKKKSKKVRVDTEDNEGNEIHNRKECHVEEQQKKKKKKEFVDVQESEDHIEMNNKESNAEEPRKKKKKKMVVDAQENNDTETHYEIKHRPDVEEPRKKKKKTLVVSAQENYDTETHEIKHRPDVEEPRKKKKKKVVVDAQGNDDDNATYNEEKCILEKPHKKKKKRKTRVEKEDDS